MNSYFDKIIDNRPKSGGLSDSAGFKSMLHASLILFSLNHRRETLRIKAIKRKAADFLLSRKDENWIFSKDANVNFCALSALAGYDKEIINGEAIAKILAGLISIESQEGGPYYSYLGGSGKSFDKNIDLAVNGNIACFLFSQEVELPNLADFIELAIVKNDFRSAFYDSIYPIIYFISQVYKGREKDKLIELILAEGGKEKHWGNPLNAAMAASALLNLGYPAEKLNKESAYLKNLSEEELVKPYPLEKGKFSTAELNIAFYLEVLEKIGGKSAGARMKNYPDSKMAPQDKEEKEIFDRVLKLAADRFSTLPNDLKIVASGEIQNTVKGNLDKQMSLMPFWFKKSLGKKADKLTNDKIALLGLMNVFFWTAFIIYDDFWDEEGTPKILPAANLYARSFIEFFNESFPRGSDFNSFFRKLMDGVDGGNTRILVNFRAKVAGGKVFIPENIPDYGDYEAVYQPSSAHILGPVAMLCELGCKINSPEVNNLISYFRNYLIAMQINDDIYDWEDDLRRGHLSTAVVMLLRDFNAQEGEIDMEKDLPELKKIFWFKTLPKACKIAISYTQKSLESLKKIDILENPAPLENLVNTIESVSKTALKEHKYTEDFLKNFKG